MPRFSAFARFSHLRFSSRKSDAEIIYHDIRANRGGEANLSGPLAKAGDYATAMAAGRVKGATTRAGNQFRPLCAVEKLPKLEWEFGIVPPSRATIRERQLAVAAAAKIARGASRQNVERVLREILGDDFVAYVPVDKSLAVQSSADPASVGSWDQPGSQKAAWRISGPITILGSPRTVTVTNLAGSSQPLRVQRRVALDLGNDTRAESVLVTASTATTFTAVFTRPHDTGTVVTAGRVPNLSSTKRQNLVILSEAAIADPEKRRLANGALRGLLRGVSTWSLSAPSALGQSGPFRVAEGRLNQTSIGAVSY